MSHNLEEKRRKGLRTLSSSSGPVLHPPPRYLATGSEGRGVGGRGVRGDRGIVKSDCWNIAGVDGGSLTVKIDDASA